MKISLLAISVIIALQATTFIHGSNERYIYHHTLHEITNIVHPFTNIKGSFLHSFDIQEEIRFIIIAFMYSASLLLFTGEAVWPAFVSQLFWLVFESNLCTDQSLSNIRSFAIQLLIFLILASNLNCCCKSNSSCSVGRSESQTSQKQNLNRGASMTSELSSLKSLGSVDSVTSEKSVQKKQSQNKNSNENKQQIDKKDSKNQKQIKKLNSTQKNQTGKNNKKNK